MTGIQVRVESLARYWPVAFSGVGIGINYVYKVRDSTRKQAGQRIPAGGKSKDLGKMQWLK